MPEKILSLVEGAISWGQLGILGALVMLTALNALQGERYIYLCEKREENEDFVFGWFLHRVVI